MEKAILGGCKRDESSVHSELNFPDWSFIHDGISKFSSELNGIYVRYLDADNNPYSFPYVLKKVRKGLSAHGLTSHLTD